MLALFALYIVAAAALGAAHQLRAGSPAYEASRCCRAFTLDNYVKLVVKDSSGWPIATA